MRTAGFGDGHIYSIDILFWIIKDLKIPFIVKPLSTYKRYVSRGSTFWQENGETIGPYDVMKYPKKYPKHKLRVDKSDLRYPILVTRTNKILDGAHRITKAFLTNKKNIKVRIIKPDILKLIIIAPETDAGKRKVKKLDIKKLKKIYKERISGFEKV
jgi:hypothetical protein